MTKFKRYLWLVVGLALLCGASGCRWFGHKPAGPLAVVTTLAGHKTDVALRDPFGVAVGSEGAIYVSDGDTGQIWQFDHAGAGRVVAQNLKTPSGLAVAKDGTLVVAETGTHTIKRVNPKDGATTVIAGNADNAGFADGAGATALFNGPVGVALGADGSIYVADTYNDRVRVIDAAGNVRTLAGSTMGYADGAGAAAQFATPCGVAVRADGALLVADTGNHRLRLVTMDGNVATWAGQNEAGATDGPLSAAQFDEPTALAIDDKGAVYVAEAGGSALRMIALPAEAAAVVTDKNTAPPYVVSMLIGQKGRGLFDGALGEARLSRPSGVGVGLEGAVIVADTGNRLVRAVNRQNADLLGVTLTLEAVRGLRPKAEEFRKLAPPRWPYAPPERPREIAATVGELRGEVNKPDEGVWFHNGLDIPGGYGETVRAVRTEKVLLPQSVALLGTRREYLRLPTMGYIHIRVGRESSEKPFGDPRFIFQRDAKGELTAIRIRRGTTFQAGDAIGTLNNQNHVHLIAGPTGGEMNALAALELPGVADTKPPVIEGVDFYGPDWQPLKPAKLSKDSDLPVQGKVRIVVRGYDQMDGNAARRRLGLYQLGYQILQANGTPANGFGEPKMTISFATLPDDVRTAPLTYAPGSMCGYTPETILGYIVTNFVRDREAREDFWDTAQMPAGQYVVRVFAEDFFGNRTTREVKVTTN